MPGVRCITTTRLDPNQSSREGSDTKSIHQRFRCHRQHQGQDWASVPRSRIMCWHCRLGSSRRSLLSSKLVVMPFPQTNSTINFYLFNFLSLQIQCTLMSFSSINPNGMSWLEERMAEFHLHLKWLATYPHHLQTSLPYNSSLLTKGSISRILWHYQVWTIEQWSSFVDASFKEHLFMCTYRGSWYLGG